MKKFTLLFAVFFTLSSWANTITPNTVKFKRQDSDHIKQVFEAWNKEKGDYLYESMAALVMHQEQPERPDGINKTPFEMLQTFDEQRIDRLDRIATQELENEKNSTRGKRESYYWEKWRAYLRTTKCEMQEGSSTGEPHVLTYDGERYDFQNAGDYSLSASEDKTFMVQTQLFRRQTNDSWSLNGGVIMNVNGDIVELKGTKEPIAGEVYVNNKLISQRDETINLPQGGTLRLNEPPKSNKDRHIPGDRFVIKWPTGEQMRVAVIRNYDFGDKVENEGMNVLYQLYVGVPKCRNDYSGLLGNNDGAKNDLVVDDISTINNDRSSYSDEELFGDQRHSPKVMSKREKSCYYIAHPFADTYQLDREASLFPRQMTTIPDSVRYPNRCVTLSDASDEKIAEGRRKSKEAGISRDEMYSTVFDYAYANINPSDQVDDTGFDQPERSKEYNEPKLDKEGEHLENNQKTNQQPIPVRPRVSMGTGIYYPNRHFYPRTSRPHPTRPSSGNSNLGRRNPNSGTSSSGREPSSENSDSGGRQPSSGGTKPTKPNTSRGETKSTKRRPSNGTSSTIRRKPSSGGTKPSRQTPISVRPSGHR